ncbi:MAG TPA: alkaline phosphatase family protein [Candidatus Sulfotelmatobacter sp.]|jgi:hypothetical protein|nr:alkaline phosphatase family protein [Candidatus Sulfotelmatobacter sp.]
MTSKWKAAVLTAALILSTTSASYAGPNPGPQRGDEAPKFKHVLLLSIDGMHAVDFLNCSKGIKGINGGEPYCQNLAELAETGINYLDTSTSKPSDSFPGLTAIVSGGSPRVEGVYYDVAYDRSLDPPATTTGNGVAGDPSLCTPGAPPMGTRSEYEEGIDIDKTLLNGGAPAGVDGGFASIDPNKLPRDPSKNCAPVYPWNFVRTNTIFGVIHAAGGYTAWSDKHAAYSSTSGPGNGKNLDDFFAPEINSIPVNMPTVAGCNPLPDQNAVTSGDDYTTSFQNIKCYDALKVNAIVNEALGKKHDGSANAPVPTIFGMNFQAVSVGQKLIQKSLTPAVAGGYLDSFGTPTSTLVGEIEFVDGSIGKMVAALKKSGAYDSTLIVVTAKHGQSPVDSPRYLGISTSTNDPVTTSPATILDGLGCLPFSEAPSNPTGIGPTEDDVSLIWLNSSCTTTQAVEALEQASPATANVAGIGQIYGGVAITTMFSKPGLPPNGDPRTPDIVVTPNTGVTYSGSSKKQAEHGGFAHDDTNVMMLLSNPSFERNTVFSTVETMQVAPTILKALGLNPSALDAVKVEGTQVLPSLPF